MSDLREKWERISKEIEETIEYKIESIAFDISIQIYKQMKKLNINKKQLAEKLNVSKSYITQLLKGKTNMTIETLVKVAEALKLTPKVELVPKVIESNSNTDISKTNWLGKYTTSAVEDSFSVEIKESKKERYNPLNDEKEKLAIA